MTVLSDPGRKLTLALLVSQTQLTPMFDAAMVLQTRAPTGKLVGPVAGLLLSSPITFHVSGVTDNAASATAGMNTATAMTPSKPSRRTTRDTSALTCAKHE